MAQQGIQVEISGCKCFAYDSVELVLLANGNRYEVDFILSDHPPFKSFHCPKFGLF
jgi:hypothetical protein